MADYDVDVLTGIATHLDNQSLGVWRPTGPAYMPTEWGIHLDAMPQDPDQAIALATYGVSDEIAANISRIGLQIRVRAGGEDPRSTRAKAGQIFQELQGRHQWVLPGTSRTVVQCWRQSWNAPTRDDNFRWMALQNFYLDVYVPESIHTI